uniref:ARAD1D31284p n=1 Tax=Blastobotrys adeninivorans TaxID=409370 RepID=A0A060TGK4_BLAAD
MPQGKSGYSPVNGYNSGDVKDFLNSSFKQQSQGGVTYKAQSGGWTTISKSAAPSKTNSIVNDLYRATMRHGKKRN